MDPEKIQQEPAAEEVSLEQAISDQFDAMDAAEAEAREDAAETHEEAQEERAARDDREDREDRSDRRERKEETKAEAEEETPYDAPAPERWPAEIKETYSKLPPEGKKAFMEGIYKPMQSSYTKRTQEMAEIRQRLDPMMQAFEQHKDVFERNGISPEQAFRDQIAWAAHFQRVGPQQGLADMQRAFNVNPAEGQQDLGDDYLTPTEKAMKQELDQLKSYVQSDAASREQQAQQMAQQRAIAQQTQGIQQELASFASTTTPDGAPKHPHLDKVAPTMAGLLRGGLVAKQDDYGNPIPMQQQLSQAYEMAVRTDPNVQAQLQQTEKQARQARLVTAASRDVPAKGPAGQVDVQAGPLSDTISNIYDQLEAQGRR